MKHGWLDWVGVRVSVDVLNVQSQVYISQRNPAKTSLDLLLLHFRLKALVSELAEVDVLGIQALLATGVR